MEQSADLKSADQPDTIRWPKFQAMLSELVEKNSFQQSHWPQIKNVSQLNGFVQFQEHCPFTTRICWPRTGLIIRPTEAT
mgnify:CR=1 FL=1